MPSQLPGQSGAETAGYRRGTGFHVTEVQKCLADSTRVSEHGEQGHHIGPQQGPAAGPDRDPAAVGGREEEREK